MLVDTVETIFLTLTYQIPIHILNLGRDEAWKRTKDIVRNSIDDRPSNPAEVQIYHRVAACRMYNKKWAENAYGEPSSLHCLSL